MDDIAHRVLRSPVGLSRSCTMVTLLPLALISGVVAALGILSPSVWFVCVFALVLFFYCLYCLSHAEYRRAAMLGFVFGIAYSGTAIFWFFAVLPLDWAGVPFWKGLLFVGFSWCMVTVGLAIFFSVFALLFTRFRTGRMTDVLLAASLWTILQYLQMWGFALVTIGDASTGAHFSPTLLGYALAAFSPLLQLAYFGGVYLLTFIAVAISAALFLFLGQKEGRSRLVWGVLFFFVFVGVTALDSNYALVRTGAVDPALKLTAVTTNYPVAVPQSDAEIRERITEIEDLLRASYEEHGAPDLVVFPEVADVVRHLPSPLPVFAQSVFGTTSVSFIDSDAARGEKSRHTTMHFYDRGTVMTETHRKVLLVPQGEYFPWLFQRALRLVGVTNEEQQLMMQRSIHAAKTPVLGRAAGIPIGGLFCSEVLSPTLYRDLTNNGAQLLVNAASHSWFHGSELVDQLVISLGRVRAVENDRYLVIAGNMVPSTVISNRGEILARSERGMTTLHASVQPRDTVTVYTRFGEYVLIIPLLMFLFLAYRNYRSPDISDE